MTLETQQTQAQPGSPIRGNPAVFKLLALMLMVGGVVGIALALLFIVNQPITLSVVVFGVIFVLVFGWSALKGLDLWKEKPAGYKWGKILFAAQVPLINFSGFSYWFYTGLNAWFMVRWGDIQSPGFAQLGVYFNLGSALNFYIGNQTHVFALAANPVAIAALAYLLVYSPSREQPLPEQVISPT